MTKKRPNKVLQASLSSLESSLAFKSHSQTNMPLSKLKSKAKDPYIIIKITGIHPTISFHSILREASKFDENIIGICRRADYRNKRLGYTVFLFSVSNNLDEKHLKTISFCFEGYNNVSSLSIVDYVIGNATIIESAFTDPSKCIPASIFIKGVKKINVGTGLSEYLANLSEEFEKYGKITAIRLNYDPIKKRTKDCGFATLLSTADANSVVNENRSIKDSQIFKLELSCGVPMLVEKEHEHELLRGKLEWSNKIEDINMLITRHQAPAVHPYGNEKDIYTGEDPPKAAEVSVKKRKLEADEHDAGNMYLKTINPYSNNDLVTQINHLNDVPCASESAIGLQNPRKVLIVKA